jgi:predicted small integral membrane protein
METTRGDRFFVSLLGSAFIHLLWLGLTTLDVLYASGLAVLWLGLIMTKG